MNEINDALYLSRIFLNPSCPQVRNELAYPYEMHRTIMHAFDAYPAQEAEKKRAKYNILFRPDIDERCGCITLYVQSTVEPDWSYLRKNNDYLLPETASVNPSCKNIARAYHSLRAGQVLSFVLRANPTKKIGKPKKGDADLKGKRVALLREEEHIEWLMRKGKMRENNCPGGFEIVAQENRANGGQVIKIPQAHAWPEGKFRHRNGHSDAMTHVAVRFEGKLRITDADAFRATLVRGIGAAKAFGFGLMSIKKPLL